MLVATYLGNRDVATITTQDVARFLTSAMAMRTADGRAKRASTANALRSSVRCLFAFAHAAGYTPTNTGRLVRRARCSPPPPRALSDLDRARLVAELDKAETVAERRDRVLFRVLLDAGLRIGSALALDVEDVDLDAGEVRLRVMKNSDQDVAFLTPGLIEILGEHLQGRVDGPVFAGADGRRLGARQAHRRLAEVAERAGIARAVSPHCLRHSFAVRLLAATSNVALVSKALAHRSLSSTMVYARVADADVRSAVAGA